MLITPTGIIPTANNYKAYDNHKSYDDYGHSSRRDKEFEFFQELKELQKHPALPSFIEAVRDLKNKNIPIKEHPDYFNILLLLKHYYKHLNYICPYIHCSYGAVTIVEKSNAFEELNKIFENG